MNTRWNAEAAAAMARRAILNGPAMKPGQIIPIDPPAPPPMGWMDGALFAIAVLMILMMVPMVVAAFLVPFKLLGVL